MKCDRCRNEAVAVVRCPSCPGRVYARCATHDGRAGARRSFYSHAALRHTGEHIDPVSDDELKAAVPPEVRY